MDMAASAQANVPPTASVPPVRSFPFQHGLIGRAISFFSGIESLDRRQRLLRHQRHHGTPLA